MFFTDPIITNRYTKAVIVAASVLIASCTDSPSGTVSVNQNDGIVLNPPEFLLSRAVDTSNLQARVTVNVGGEDIAVTQSNQSSSPWIGQVFVPSGSNPTISVTWVETDVPGLQSELLLATYTATLGESIDTDQTFQIDTNDYRTGNSAVDPEAMLDIDNDGFSNLLERIQNTGPADGEDMPLAVTIPYTDRSPLINGRWDDVWEFDAQYNDADATRLSLDKVLINEAGAADDDRGMYWAAVHDGVFLYLLIFAEEGIHRTPHADSSPVYLDDSIDIYWDGDNSKGLVYDEDDYHYIIGLLDADGNENRSGLQTTRLQKGDNSVVLDESAIEFGICLCDGSSQGDTQQLYEVRINLVAAGIPINSRFGLEINVNDDADGQRRDAKWGWFNTTGVDNTWQVPNLMGNAILESPP